MSQEEIEARNYYQVLKNAFNNPENQTSAIDLSSYDSLSIKEIDKIDELRHFFGLDEDGPYSEFLSKGLKSLRVGFYKICSQPFYNIGIYPHTFSASVYYFHPDFPEGELIKYEANVGPITNIHSVYEPLLGTFPLLPVTDPVERTKNIPIRQKYLSERVFERNKEENYFLPKRDFFDSVYLNGKIFGVSESIFHPNFPDDPRPKKVTWSFIDF